ncbi:Peptidyl-prolyl cis-trans isomerase CWC27 like protein [Eufriesea mexicana]|uniref:Spliceosome-associated protein CWC27 homolog n=1 Tax=Eufriesea mexicana TaxID=516756 RepID=A0A310SJZ7_9HYME|nr:Peptidyl-prolyl cis-trans isomerase CWC27 like protein [Eufriesea mexicana]
MCRNIYSSLETIKASGIIVLWHNMGFIGPIRTMSKGGKAIIKGFITQDSDLTGTGIGDKIYGEPFIDDFHTRLRFCRRDLIAMANAGKDDSSSQFFLTLSSIPDLQNIHTMFGKSAYDHLTDPKLSSQPAVEPPGPPNKKRKKVKKMMK